MTSENTNASEPFDPNQFAGLEDVKKPACFKGVEEFLNTEVPPTLPENYKTDPCKAAHLEVERRLPVDLLKVLWPVAHKRYSDLKYANGEHPSLEDRRRAYEFAMRAFLRVAYTQTYA